MHTRYIRHRLCKTNTLKKQNQSQLTALVGAISVGWENGPGRGLKTVSFNL